MKIKLNKGCVIGDGKTGEAGKTVDVDPSVAKSLIASGAAQALKDKSTDK